MVLPTYQHRLPLMRKIRDWHGNSAASAVENASLGVVGVFGLGVLLLGALAGFPRKSKPRTLLVSLSFLTILAIIIGTTGGLGPVFAYFISPEIRGYNRISIYIQFFAITAIFVIIDDLLKRFGPSRIIFRNIVAAGFASFLLVAGILDQSPVIGGGAQGPMRTVETFVQNIQTRLPEGAMVLELPYMRFPESGGVNRIEDYDPAPTLSRFQESPMELRGRSRTL